MAHREITELIAYLRRAFRIKCAKIHDSVQPQQKYRHEAMAYSM